MTDKKRRPIRRALAKIISKALGGELVTSDLLTKALNQREAEVRALVADQKEENEVLTKVQNFYNLGAVFEERHIPKRFVQFAESLGITSENDEAIDLFESLIWKDRNTKKDETSLREAANWIPTAQYVGIASQRLMTEEMRKVIKDFSFYWFSKSPGFRGGLRELRRYVIGKGTDWTINVQEIKDKWQEFWDYNRLEKRHKGLFEYALLCGELTLVVRKDENDQWWLSNVPYFESDFDNAVITAPDNRDKVVAIGRRLLNVDSKLEYEYYKMSDDLEGKAFPSDLKDDNNATISAKEDAYAIYMVFNGFADEKRGRPAFHSALKYNKILDDFVLNRARLNDYRSRIMMVRTKTESASKDSGGKYQQMPTGGVILNETAHVKYRWEAPKIEAGDAYNDGKLFMYLVCAAMEVPPHIAFQISENSNYNSIREADTPFTQVVLDWQDDWKELYETIFYLMLNIWIEDQTLKQSYKTKKRDPELGVEIEVDQDTVDTPVTFNFPDIVQKNIKDKTDETVQLSDKGILSKKTASVRHNLDYDAEQEQIDKEKAKSKEEDAAKMDQWQQGQGLLPGTKFPDTFPQGGAPPTQVTK